MYIKPKTDKRAKIDAKELSYFCERQTEIFKYANQKEVDKNLKVGELGHLTPLLVSFLFKERIGVIPYDFEEVSNE
jgi:hypothetical protein